VHLRSGWAGNNFHKSIIDMPMLISLPLTHIEGMMRNFFICFLLTTVSVQIATAQKQPPASSVDDEADDPYDNLNYFMYGIDYLSNNVYLGRKDTTVIPYISPYIGGHFKSGIYVKATISYAPVANDGHIDLTTLEGGYDHTFGDHLNTGTYLDFFLYNKNSLSTRASTKASAGVYGQYANKWIEPEINFDYNINKSSQDYVSGIQADHDFALLGKTLHIFPTFIINFGTQNYYDEYFITRTRKDKTVKVKKAIANATKFNTLDYEFSVKATYRIKKWMFTCSPTYAIPVSPATITLPKKTISEKLANTFFVSLDVCHR
jgi:hypothetical protein